MTTPPSLPSTSDDGLLARPMAERIADAARRMVLLDELEDVMTTAAAAVGDALGSDAVVRVTTAQHDLHAVASGIVPAAALPTDARAALDDGGGAGILLESAAELVRCRSWVADGEAEPRDVARLVGELLLHSLVQSVERSLIVGRNRRNEANLERALESHRLIGQAMGILIERHRIVGQEAFDLLRRASQDRNVKLREVAERVIETGAEPGEVV